MPLPGSPPPEAPKRRLLDQVRDKLRLKHYGLRTEETYVHWIKRFIYFHGKRHPGGLGEAEVTVFLDRLVRSRDAAAAMLLPEAAGLPDALEVKYEKYVIRRVKEARAGNAVPDPVPG